MILLRREKMKISIYGAGSWGTAMACILHHNGHDINLWSRRSDQVAQLLADGENKTYLPGIALPSSLTISNDYCLGKNAEMVILAVPSTAVKELANAIGPYISPNAIIVNLAKGFFPDNQERLSIVIKEELPNNPVLTLSGPSHAEEAARNLPTTVVIAGQNIEHLQKAQDVFMNNSFRVYPNTDQIGVEVGGAVKNIIGLGAGIIDGLNQGDNAKAALITRGLAEMKRLGMAMGAESATFLGLAGVGDLIATCTSIHSRNFRAGQEIGRGKPWHQVLEETSMVVEGVFAAESTYKLAKKLDVDMPITEQIYHLLYDNRSPQESMQELMTRARTKEE
jgi:glycerol-3-phosphate dehydrogenase (NAD(P)+)